MSSRPSRAPSRRAGAIAGCALVAATAIPLGAASPWIDPRGYDPGEVGSPRPELTVPRLERLPELEDFLSMAPSAEFAGRLAHVDGGFVQRDPEDGRPASQHTDVYLAYDDDALVVVFVAFDDDPDRIRAHLAPREAFFGDELVEVQLDTFLDRRRAYTFGCNPLGVQWDAVWQEGNEFDSSWEAVWDSRGRVTAEGYVVWFRIPFRSLRFPRTSEQRWGILLVRDIPRNNESSFWPRMSSRIQGRIQQSATLVGLRDISPGRNLQLIPYATAASYRDLDDRRPDDVRFVEDDLRADAGVDGKAVLWDRLVLDATLNPDFSQVESDEPQVTVNERFEVFFPEKRPFFVENADYFATPVNLLFTRRIADPRGGLRLTGKSGRHGVGLLWIDDEAPGKRAPPGDPQRGEVAEFRVARWTLDVAEQSRVGLMGTERRLAGAWNRVASGDVRWAIDDHWVATAQWAESRTRSDDGTTISGGARDVVVGRSGRRWDVHAHVRDYEDTFRAEAGFVPRLGIVDTHAVVTRTFWPEGPRLISWGPTAYVERVEDRDGLRLDRRANASLEFSFRRQTRLELTREWSAERLRPRDFPVLDDALDFDTWREAVEVSSAAYRVVQVDGELERGRTILFAPPDGEPPGPVDYTRATVQFQFRPLGRLRADTDWIVTRIEEPAGGARVLTDEIARLKVTWQFDRRASLRLITRYDALDTDPTRTARSDEKNWNVDVLFRYLANPWTALYVGYNSNETNLEVLDDGAGGLVARRTDGLDLRDSRQVFVKLSYLFRL